MTNKNNFDISGLSQKEIKNRAALMLKKVSNPEKGVGKELFDAIISLAPQTTVEAVIVDDIDKPTKVLVTPRNDRNYPKHCHLPGSFIRYGETFPQRLSRLIMNELGTKVKRFKDTNIKYNCWEKKNKRHLIGFYFLVELKSNPIEEHRWVDYIPKNIIGEHGDFLKSYFGWPEGRALWG